MDRKRIFLCLLFFTGIVNAVEMQYIQFTPHADLFKKTSQEAVSCNKVTSCDQIELGVTVEKGQLTSALFIYGRELSFPRTVNLTNDEIKGIDLYIDSGNRVWVKKLHLNKRLFSFLIPYCWSAISPNNIKTIDTAEQIFSFPTELLGEEIVLTQSGCGGFSGKLKDKDETPYVIPILFRQEHYK